MRKRADFNEITNSGSQRTYLKMKSYKLSIFSLIAVLLSFSLANAQTTAEWSTKVWATASDGKWEAVVDLLEKAPNGNNEALEKFHSQLETYRLHREEEITTALEERDAALEEMKTHFENGKTLQSLQSAVKAQTLSKSLDDIMYNSDVQNVLTRSQEEIDSLDNILTVQTLLYYLRTFYEGTSRRDLYEKWNDELEEIALKVSLLRQYAPEHLHELTIEKAIVLGDEPPEPYSEQSNDNWKERIDDIDKRMLIRSLSTAVQEHIDGVEWSTIIKGGLEAVRTLGEIPVIKETFKNAAKEKLQKRWVTLVDEELHACDEYLLHIPGKRVLTQIIDRLITANQQSMQLPEGMIFREFGEGAMNKLDKYSAIIWPDEYRRFQQQTEGSFVGVGIVIRENTKGEVMVVNPIEGSPAYYGGVQPDDIISAVNGKSTTGWSLNDAVDRITGPRGTGVTLTILRQESDEPIDLFLTRDHIKLHSVQGWWKKGLDEDGNPEWDWLVDKENKIGYVKLTGFSEETYSDMINAIRVMQSESPPNGLILDLRYNPGGLLPTARQISNLFVSSGTIVSGEAANGEELFRMSARANRAYLADWPVVILINQGSASASEIVSGCVQAHDAGIIVGQRSWGKGSVQTVHQVSSESNVKLTTQYYRLPSPDGGMTPGRLVHKRRGSSDWGVVPDVEVRMSPSQITKSNELRQKADLILIDSETDDRPDINDLITKGLDPQLETALLLLRANALSKMISDLRRAQLD
jgi:carboxyl-terminal processing protease